MEGSSATQVAKNDSDQIFSDRVLPQFVGVSIACHLCSGRKGGCTSCSGTGEAKPTEFSKVRRRIKSASIL